jgi:hypothetical protein
MMAESAMLNIDPLLSKRAFAEARGCSLRTLERMVKQKLVPRGEPINGTALGWRASLVNKTLSELAELAKAQPDEDAAEQEARSGKMREMGAKGGWRKRAGAQARRAISTRPAGGGAR